MKNSRGMIVLLVTLAALTLLVVVGLFFFYPKEPAKTAVNSPTPTVTTPVATPLPDEFDPVEWVRNPQTTPIQTPAATPAPGDQGFTVTLPQDPSKTSATGLPQSPGAVFPGDPSPKTNVVTPSTVRSTPVTAPVVNPARTTAPASVKTEAAPKTVKVTEYWIQVASFKDRYQAENTAKSLESQGLKGTLTTATVNGQAVVRVRVGPYTNDAEAGKFLAWLKPLKEFESSYITKTTATRTR